jgi:hypothetical protein
MCEFHHGRAIFGAIFGAFFWPNRTQVIAYFWGEKRSILLTAFHIAVLFLQEMLIGV